MTHKVAIILLHYASLEQTKKCIEKLRTLDYPSKQLYVIDNASSQPCKNIVHDFWPEAVVIRAERNLGVAGGRNFGFKLAQQAGAEWAFCVDDDIIVEQQTLPALMAKALEFSNVAAVGPKTFDIDRPNILLHATGKYYKTICHGRSVGFLEEDKGQYDHLNESDWLAGFATLINLSIIEKIGGFDEQMAPYGPEDLDWFLRARNAGYRVLFAPRSHAWHPKTGANGNLTLTKVENSIRGRILFIRKQPQAVARFLGHTYSIYRWVLKPFPGVARNKQLGPYYSAVLRGIKKGIASSHHNK
jgi:GT2 family glycosyltransferase